MAAKPGDESSSAHPFPESWEGGGHAHLDLDQRSSEVLPTSPDERVRAAVCERLRAHPQIDASTIAVSVESGEVTLSGSVTDAGVAEIARGLALASEGVVAVHDRIEVHAT